MDKDTRIEIIEALKDYSKENNLKSDQLKLLTGVSKSYIEAMLAGSDISGKTTIGDVHFKKVAQAIGYNIEPVFWQHIDTEQCSEMYIELMDAKAKCENRVIIGQSRCGKTYTLGLFKKKHPAHSYVVTVGSLHSIIDILDDICIQMGIAPKGNKVSKLRKIATYVKSLKMRGQKPILMIDEAENLKAAPLRMIKDLYDALLELCPIALIGTEQLLENLEELKNSKRNKNPQLYYRFVAGIRELEEIDKDKMFAPFLELVEDEGIRTYLFGHCDNYGMLNDYITPALREAHELGMPLTEKFFYQKYKLN